MNSDCAVSSSTGDDYPVKISSDEAELYDRQIRLWGLEAQNRLRNSNVLICGMTALGCEVAKNLILCGLKSVKLMDDQVLTEKESKQVFLADATHVGKNRAWACLQKARELNPMVSVNSVEGDVYFQDEKFYQEFDLIVLVDQKHKVNIRVDDLCRKYNVRFQACGVFGWTGYAFFDFNGFEFLVKKPVKSAATVETTLDDDMETDELAPAKPEAICFDISAEPEDLMEKKAIQYESYSAAFDIEWELLKKYTRQMKRAVPQSYFPIRALLTYWDKHAGGNTDELNIETLTELWNAEILRCNQDFSLHAVQPEQFKFFSNPPLIPACAVVGGLVSQEAIKALSQKERPLKNVFFYSGLDSTSIVCDYPPRR